ncbi:MAG TPA: hypothetical protein VGJ69_12895 [Pyrinomonadaceae bacterium]|jgi:hypothetical protein
MKLPRNQRQSPTANAASNESETKLRTVTLLVFAASFLAYVLLLTKNYYWDGIFFAQVIEDAPRVNASLIHPSHLLDLVFEYAAYRATRMLGFHPRALTVLQVSNCFLAAAAVALFFRICIDCFRSRYVSLVLTALFAFSATWWKFATDADTYIVAMLLLLITFYQVLPGRRSRPYAVAVTHSLAMLLHQLSVFFFPVAIAGLIFQAKNNRPNQGRANAVKYTLTVIALTVGVYYYTFHVVTGTWSFGRFVSWITYFSPENGFTFSLWNNFVFSVRSQWRTFLGGRVAFIRDLWGPAILVLASLTIAAAAAFLFMLLRHWKELKASVVFALRNSGRFKPLTILCVLWIVPYLVFLFFFIPQNTFYRLFYLPAIILLAGMIIAAAESAPNQVRRYRAALFAAVVFFANLTFSQYPYTQPRANPPLELALKLNQIWTTGTTVYFASPNTDDSLIRYFNPGTVWVQAAPDAITRQIQELSPSARVGWLDTTLIDQFESTAEGKAWLEAHTAHRPDSELVNKKFRIRFRQLKPDSFRHPPN